MVFFFSLFSKGCGERSWGPKKTGSLPEAAFVLGVVWRQEQPPDRDLRLGAAHSPVEGDADTARGARPASLPARPAPPRTSTACDLCATPAAPTTRPCAGHSPGVVCTGLPKGPGAAKAASGGSCGVGLGSEISLRVGRQPHRSTRPVPTVTSDPRTSQARPGSFS